MNDAAANYEVALLKRWNNFTSAFPSDLKEKWWKQLEDSYRERPFHSFKHLNDMFLLFDEYKHKLQEQIATGFAMFFLHGSNNVEESAEQLRQFLSEASFNLGNYSTRLILESGKHCTDAHLIPDTYGKLDIHFLLDFDIAFLGVDQIEYNKHSQNIRKEYSHLNDEEYRQQKLKVLKLFIRIPNIYATRELRERFEVQARQNIANEISELSK